MEEVVMMDKSGNINTGILKNNNLFYDKPEGQHTSKTNQFAHFARFAQSVPGNKKGDLLKTKTIPNEVYENLPTVLKKACSVFETQREKDIFLTGAIGTLSGCFNTVKGLYASEEHYPNMNCFIVGPAGGGKGAMKHAKKLAEAIHNSKLNESKLLWKQYLALKKDNKNQQEPPQKLLIIPANSSSAAVIRHLMENDESGIIFETEADSLNGALDEGWSDYSDMLRKAFHHETVSSSRKTNREYLEIKHPKLSVVLSGTPDQVTGLIPSVENGLFSRMIFYVFDGIDSWRSVAPKNNKMNLNNYFVELGKEVEQMGVFFSKSEFDFELTEMQWKVLDKQFSDWLDEMTTFVGKDTSSIVKRLGLVQFRIAMLLSIIKFYEEGNCGTKIICSDVDFKTAQLLSDVYLSHSLAMFGKLPKEGNSRINNDVKRFYESLPEGKTFSRDEAVKVGKTVKVEERTSDKYLKRLVEINYLHKPEYGKYRKN